MAVTVEGTDLFDHGNFGVPGGGPYQGIEGSPAKDTTVVHPSDPASLLIEATSAFENVQYDLSGSPTMPWCGFRFRQNAADEIGNTIIMKFFCAAGGNASLGYLATNRIYQHLDGSSTFPDLPVSLDAWHWVEVILNTAVNPRQMRCRIDGVDMSAEDFAVATSTATHWGLGNMGADSAKVRFGRVMWGTTTSITTWLGEPQFLFPGAVVHTRASGLAVIARASQLAIPTADSVDGSWTDHAGGTSLFAAIDETAPSDADYIRSPVAPANSGCRVKLGSIADPNVSNFHEIHWRIGKDFTGGPMIDMEVRLYQGGGDVLGAGTLIADFQRTNVGQALSTFVETLSGAEADAITNYGDLYLEFYADES